MLLLLLSSQAKEKSNPSPWPKTWSSTIITITDGVDARSVSHVRPVLTRTGDNRWNIMYSILRIFLAGSSLSGRIQDDTSSMSNMSGISNTSARTFVTEESSLVLETLENGLHHHYLVPLQVAKKGRFKKKGTKLHVYMDHIFVAQHMKLYVIS